VDDKPVLIDRTLQFSLRVIRLCRELEKDHIGRVLGKQLLRSGTSIGANAHEAQGGQSKADFIAKMSVAHKEALETVYWLRLISEARLLSNGNATELLGETEQLVKIISRILITSKSRRNSGR